MVNIYLVWYCLGSLDYGCRGADDWTPKALLILYATNALIIISLSLSLSLLLSRFILEHGQQFWYLSTMLESGTWEQKTLTRGILAKKHMLGLWIRRLPTKLSCPCQKMLSIAVPLANCRSMYIWLICAKYSSFLYLRLRGQF